MITNSVPITWGALLTAFIALYLPLDRRRQQGGVTKLLRASNGTTAWKMLPRWQQPSEGVFLLIILIEAVLKAWRNQVSKLW